MNTLVHFVVLILLLSIEKITSDCPTGYLKPELRNSISNSPFKAPSIPNTPNTPDISNERVQKSSLLSEMANSEPFSAVNDISLSELLSKDSWFSPEVSHFTNQEMRIATFNAYWLFNETRTSTSSWPWKNSNDLKMHHEKISNAFTILNSDILNIVEVSSNCSYIHNLVDASNMSSNPEIYVVEGKDTATKQNVALVTPFKTELIRSEYRVQYPIQNSKCKYCVCSDSTPQSSGVSKHYFSFIKLHYENLNVEDWIPLLIVGVHLKAIPTDPVSCAQRESQASVLVESVRVLLNEIQRRYPTKKPSIIMMGDFNDYDSGITDKYNNIPTSMTLELIRNSLNMSNVFSQVDQDLRYSHWWDKNGNHKIDLEEQSLIDHILISNHMMPFITEVNVFSQYLYPTGDLMTSDHWPIGFTLNISQLAHSIIESGNASVLHTCFGKTAFDPNVCSGNGLCQSSNVCTCKDGYIGTNCEKIACHNIPVDDKNVCSGRGICIEPNKCNCTSPHYQGENCDQRTFPICFGIESIESQALICSGKGICISDNTCQCDSNYGGPNCQYPKCNQMLSNHPAVCSGHGQCLAPNKCSCDDEYGGSQCHKSISESKPKDEDNVTPKSNDEYNRAIIVILILVILVSILLVTQLILCLMLVRKQKEKKNSNTINIPEFLEGMNIHESDDDKEMDNISLVDGQPLEIQDSDLVTS